MTTEIHACPRCQLRFVGTVELRDHLASDHPMPEVAPPPPPPPIVVPLDPARPPTDALPLGMALAMQSGAPLQLVAMRPAGLGPQTPSAYLSSQVRAARRGGVDRVGHKALEGPDPAVAILDHLGATHASLLCLASHGRSALSEVLLGSVSETVVRRSPIPVVLVGPEVKDPAAPIESVVAGVEGVELGPAVLDVARRVAALLGAGLSLVQVVDEDPVPPDIVESGWLHRLAATVPQPVDYETVRDHDPVAGLLEVVGKQPGTLLAVGTHGRSGLQRAVLGSVAFELVRWAPCPVLVAPPALLSVEVP
jgi:nucleotide-binding universal stress UspA family protein